MFGCSILIFGLSECSYKAVSYTHLDVYKRQRRCYAKECDGFQYDNVYNEIGLNLVDVVGWNLYHGLYEGELNGFDRCV